MRRQNGSDSKFRHIAIRIPLEHPVFCDFGNSRWDIRFDIHEMRKRESGTRRQDASELVANGLRMGLWDRRKINDEIPLRWSCKRLIKDLALHANGGSLELAVSRADRLGRAVAGANAEDCVTILGLFDQKEWNGRLEAPRRELNAIVRRVAKIGMWDRKCELMCRRLHWLVTFSAKLQPQGPWHNYAKQFSDGARTRPFVSKKGEYAVKHEGNDSRKGLAKLILARLAGLRILSVDLGHRFAAACAVWETLSQKELKRELKDRQIVRGGISARDLFVHNEHLGSDNKSRTTIYRRTGPDMWARLDRQFTIKLQGEEKPSRKASPDEIRDVQRLEEQVGRSVIDRGGQLFPN
jgi:hypothetical protein